MKKAFIIAFIGLMSVVAVNAQECELCGIWTGKFRVNYDDYTVNQIYISINKYGERYIVKVKEAYTYDDQSSKTYYWNDCTNVTVNGNVISWKSFSHDHDDWGDYRVNGVVVDRSKSYYKCTAVLDNGILLFSQTVEGIYFDKHGNVIGEHHQPPFPTKELFKEENNW